MDYRLTMIQRGEVFNEHPGVLFFNTAPQVKYGELIRFSIFGEVIHLGRVIAVEGPSSCIRPDTAKNAHKFKVHWFPVDSEEANRIQAKTGALDCPNGCTGRTAVYISDREGKNTNSRGTRYRKCPKCDCRWITKEVYVERVKRRTRKETSAKSRT